jgi:hypothetical protein
VKTTGSGKCTRKQHYFNFPNPVVNRTVNISFDAFAGKNHTIQLVDVNGHILLNRTVNINGKTTSQ